MKIAVIGSRKLTKIKIDDYIPEVVTEIVSGGASGVDTLAKEFAQRKGLRFTEFLPEYHLCGRSAPLKRNENIVKYADAGIALWDGCSKGTEYTIKCFKKANKKITVIIKEGS